MGGKVPRFFSPTPNSPPVGAHLAAGMRQSAHLPLTTPPFSAMCQLLGMNCNTPTDICFSFAGLHARGGRTDIHRDGWGIAFFEGPGTRIFLDTQAASESPMADFVRRYPIRSQHVVAHIRYATRGGVALENTHPFQRELWGRYWVFAHNGTLKGFNPAFDGHFTPVGATDSEAAFCTLLSRFKNRFGLMPPMRDELFDVLAELTREISVLGEFNFLLSNGEWLIAHASSRLSYIIRRAPFAAAHLADEDLTVDFSTVTQPDDRVAVIATTPLTDNETWTPITPGTLMLFENGQPVRSAVTRPFVREEKS